MTDKLKPCPFCGITDVSVLESPYGGWFAKCGQCGAEIGSPNSAEEAHENWNNRAQPEKKPLTLEQLKQMDGEPVYFETNTELGNFWALIARASENKIKLVTTDTMHHLELLLNAIAYGSVKAYAHKPEVEK